MRYLFIFVVLFAAPVLAQEDQPQMIKPGRTMQPAPKKSYADSAEFLKLFNQLYPKIKPAQTVREMAQQHYKAISRSFAMQGIDSAEAARAAFNNLSDSAFYTIYFDIFRRNLSAKELKTYIDFITTPEGAHIAEVMPSLQRVLPDANMYVARTINMNLTPLRQAAREKWEKEHPPEKRTRDPKKSMQMPAGNGYVPEDLKREVKSQIKVDSSARH